MNWKHKTRIVCYALFNEADRVIGFPMRNKKPEAGFTILELLVAVSVTALLATMLLNITSQVVTTQTEATGDLETNQVAQFILDRIQEDLQCAVSKNDGNVWMAIKLLLDEEISGEWKKANSLSKPALQSVRVFEDDWPESLSNDLTKANRQGPLVESRFGIGGAWLRFFTQAPELDPMAKNTGSVRAVSYQIIRHGLTGSETSRPRYQLFRSDVSAKNTLTAGYNLDSENYNQAAGIGEREAGNITNPIFQDRNGRPSTDFSLAANVIDFGIRAYVMEKNRKGTGFLKQIFPELTSSDKYYEFRASTHSRYQTDSNRKYLNSFPEVIDVMVRILTSEGASAVAALEDGLIPVPSGYQEDEYWWDLAEKNSEVYIRRIKIMSTTL